MISENLQLALSLDQIEVLFAALLAMTQDIHFVQDNLTEDQMNYADALCAELQKILDNRLKEKFGNVKL